MKRDKKNERPSPAIKRELISRRGVTPQDKPFLFKLYASTREEELASLPWSVTQKQNFLQMQFNLRQNDYQSRLDPSGYEVILHDNAEVGAMWVSRSEDEIRLADLSLLPAYRGAGIGTALLRELLDESDRIGKPLRLMVWKMNLQALQLYERLGFSVVGDTGVHFQLERPPAKERDDKESEQQGDEGGGDNA